MTSHRKDRTGRDAGDRAQADRRPAALRENLKRRKAQARARRGARQGPSHDSAGFEPDTAPEAGRDTSES